MASTTDVIEALKYTYGTEQVLYLLNQETHGWSRAVHYAHHDQEPWVLDGLG